MRIHNIRQGMNGVSFSGHNKSVDKQGEIAHNFYYLYDDEKYDCELELYNIQRDARGNIKLMEDPKKGPAWHCPLPKEGKVISVPYDTINDDDEISIVSDLGFAYRFKLTRKDDKEKKYPTFAFDNGDVLGIKDTKNTDNKFNLVFNNRASINVNGPMQLIMPDSYNPFADPPRMEYPVSLLYSKYRKPEEANLYQRLPLSDIYKKTNETPGAATVNACLDEFLASPLPDKPIGHNEAYHNQLISTVRTHANKIGGGFQGILDKLRNGDIKAEGITRIVGTPFTRDTVSSHMYWTENGFRISPSIGDENDFRELQVELFKNGINWIADAALVNEGLGGIHLYSLLRNGRDSYAGGMFRGDGVIKLGVLPNSTDKAGDETAKHTKMKIINQPFDIEKGNLNLDYDDTRPTYIQLYDDRLATKTQIDTDYPSQIRSYENKNVKDENGNVQIYDITKHDDAVYPFAFEVDPNELEKNFRKAAKKYNITDLRAIPYEAIKEITEFENFQLVEKSDAAGLELWDGNVDIAKLKFFNIPGFDKGTIQNYKGALLAQDYAINVGRYWTRLAATSQLSYIVDQIGKHPLHKEIVKDYEELKSIAQDCTLYRNPKKIKTEEEIKEQNNENAERQKHAHIEVIENYEQFIEKLKNPDVADTNEKNIEQLEKIQARIIENYEKIIADFKNPDKKEYEFPKERMKDIDESIVKNVLSGNYYSRLIDSDVDTRSDLNTEMNNLDDTNEYYLGPYIMKKALETPIETLPLSNNLMSILASPYFTPRPASEKEVGLSRYDLLCIRNDKDNPDNNNKRLRNLHEKIWKMYDQEITNILVEMTRYIGSNSNEQALKLARAEVKEKNLDMNTEMTPDRKFKDTEFEKIYNIYYQKRIEGKDVIIDRSKYDIVTEYGRYVLSEIIPDLSRYILLRAIASYAVEDNDARKDMLDPRTPYNINRHVELTKDLNFDFSGVDDETLTMQIFDRDFGMGMMEGSSAEDLEMIEAEKVADDIEKAISKIYNRKSKKNAEYTNPKEVEPIIALMKKRFENRTLGDYKIAEMILDRTESGLGWRIDAAKDVASMDAYNAGLVARNKAEAWDKTWDNVINFWSKFNAAVLAENPHAYTTAEITDLALLVPGDKDNSNPDYKRKYSTDTEAERKFYEQTGITSGANYNYLYSGVPSVYTKFSLDNGVDGGLGWDGWKSGQGITDRLQNILVEGWEDNPGFLFQSPDDGVTNSYTFVGNHDKPRMLHGLALDMNLFHGGYEGELGSKEHKQIAYYVLNPDKVNSKSISTITDSQLSQIDFDKYSGKSIAMAYRIDQAIDDVVKENPQLNSKLDILKKAASNLAQGLFKGKNIDFEAFGTRPFEIAIRSVFEEAEYLNKKNSMNCNSILQGDMKKDLEADLLKSILVPAFEKNKAIYKALIALPGSPTDFAGDKLGSTGFETKAKNYYQQNRNITRWDWLTDPRYSFIKKYYDEMNEISKLRSKPELSALNNGATVFIPVSESSDAKAPSQKIQALLRYDEKGSVVLTLHNNAGFNVKNNEHIQKVGDGCDKILLNPDFANAKAGLKHGISEGMVFKNAVGNDGREYIIKKETKDGKDYYYLTFNEKTGSMGGYINKNIPIVPEDINTLILYKVRDN